MKKFTALFLSLTASAYAQSIPISGLPNASLPLTGAEQFPLVQGGVTKKATVGNVNTYILNQPNTWTAAQTFSAGSDPLIKFNAAAGQNNALWFQNAGVTKWYLYNDSLTNAMNFGVAGGANPTVVIPNNGGISLYGQSSGAISVKPQAAAGTYNFNLPTSAGTTGQLLTSGGGSSSAMTWSSRNAVDVTSPPYNAKCDVTEVYGQVTIASGSTNLTVANAAFTAADVGKSIVIHKAGASGVTNTNLATTIVSYVSPTQVVLANAASVTLSASLTDVAYGTNDTSAIQSAITADLGGIRLPNRTCFITQIVFNINNQYMFGVNRSRLKAINSTVATVAVNGSYNKFYNFDVDGSRYDANTAPGGENAFFVFGSFNKFDQITTFRGGRGYSFGPQTKTITSLTSVTTTATATTSSPHGFATGQVVSVEGADPVAYNGQYVVTVTGPTTFTYTFAGGTSPATVFSGYGNIFSAVSTRGNEVTNGRIGDMSDIGISMNKHEEAVITNNTIFSIGLEAITVDVWSHRARVVNNAVYFSCLWGGNGGLGWDGSDDVIVANNYIEQGTKPGIFIAAHVASPGGTGGASSFRGVITGNNINNSSGTGVLLEYFTGPDLGWGINHYPTTLIVEGNNVRTTGDSLQVQSGVEGNRIGLNNWNTGAVNDTSTLNTYAALETFKTPVTVTAATYSVRSVDKSIIANRAGTITLTLPSAAIANGREIYVKTITANTVVSASANVVPLAGGAAAVNILPATAGAWATLKYNGTNWEILASGP
jgi:hypothetical protein